MIAARKLFLGISAFSLFGLGLAQADEMPANGTGTADAAAESAASPDAAAPMPAAEMTTSGQTPEETEAPLLSTEDAYFGVLGTYTEPDEDREPVEYGGGVHVLIGKQYSENWNLELAGSATVMETDNANSDFYRYALGVDALYMLDREGFEPFLLAGAGVVYNDVLESFSDDKFDPFVNLGIGFISDAINDRGVRIRGEVRAIYDLYDYAFTGEDSMLDYRVGLGVQLPLNPPAAATQVTSSADSDGDGVVDGVDRCPNTMKGLQVDQYGCAIAQTFVLKGVSFDFDSTRLGVNAQTILDDAVKTMLGQPTMKVEIAGHTDNYGTDEYNNNLSQRRAEAVREYLISKSVGADSLRATGYGEAQPVASNETDFGREQNRRVEFRIESQ
jgi:OOP family OmpA-OmpF porin